MDAIHLLGEDTIEGWADKNTSVGDDTIMGNVNALMASPAFKNAIAQRLALRQPLLHQTAPTKKRRQPVGMGYTFTAAGQATISVQPQCLFRGEKLLVTESLTGTTVINGIFVGNKSQFPTLQNSIPSAAFGPSVLDNELLLDTCQPAIFITMQVTCSTASVTTPCVWSATIFGHSVQ